MERWQSAYLEGSVMFCLISFATVSPPCPMLYTLGCLFLKMLGKMCVIRLLIGMKGPQLYWIVYRTPLKQIHLLLLTLSRFWILNDTSVPKPVTWSRSTVSVQCGSMKLPFFLERKLGLYFLAVVCQFFLFSFKTDYLTKAINLIVVARAPPTQNFRIPVS